MKRHFSIEQNQFERIAVAVNIVRSDNWYWLILQLDDDAKSDGTNSDSLWNGMLTTQTRPAIDALIRDEWKWSITAATAPANK